MGKGMIIAEDIFARNKVECLNLLNNYLFYNGIDSLKDLDVIPLDLVSFVHNGSVHGRYLPFSMVRSLISVRKKSAWRGLNQGYPLWSVWIET